jgi:putative tryptophan/tyrosine transport system substrate-binding protein
VRRRTFIAALGGAAAWPMLARGQRAAKQVRIGVLASLALPPLQRFARKLEELGYIEGRNLQIEYRFAAGRDVRYPELAAELVALPVDVIVTWGTPAALAAKRATRTIPIIMGAIGEAVYTGVVSNLARPGGNITGFAAVSPELESKRLELLKELLPQLSRVAILANEANPLLDPSLKVIRPAAQALNLNTEVFAIRDMDQIGGALREIGQSHPDAVLVAPDTQLVGKRAEITESFADGKLPAVYPFREYSEVGGLIVHGANLSVLFERAAGYVDRIAKGENPGDLPVQQATEFELIINLKTAAGLGLKIPPTLVARADEVIE